MKNKRGRRALETIKTILIVLLACSALFLASYVLFPGGIVGLFSRIPTATTTASGAGQTALSDETLRPVAMAVTSAEGRCGLFYDRDERENYTLVSALLAEGLSAAGAPRQIAQSGWQQALAQPGLYWEYLGELPLDDLTRWLSGQPNQDLAGYSSNRLVVTRDRLYFYSDRLDTAYFAPLSRDLSQTLADLSEVFSPNGARFAFEDKGYRKLRLDSLLLSPAPGMPGLVASDPVGVDEAGQSNDSLSRLLRALSFHPQTNPLYAITGGWAINDGSDTLRISNRGVISFRQSGDNEPRYAASAYPIDLTRSLAEQTVGAVSGDARLSLLSCETKDGVTTVLYGYVYRGAGIHLDEEGWCARFLLKDGAVTEFTLRPRHYLAGDEPVLLLPQEQAVAALSGAERQTVRLVYADDRVSDVTLPFWAALRQ